MVNDGSSVQNEPLRAAMAGLKFKVINEPLVKYRVHLKQNSLNKKDMLLKLFKMYLAY